MNNKHTLAEEYHKTDDISYKIIYKKIKHTYIQIKDGMVIVRAPIHTDIKHIDNIVNDKKSWIRMKLQEQANLKKNNYQDGDIIKVLGKPYILKILYTSNKRNVLSIDNKYIYCNLNKSAKDTSEKESVKKLIDKYYKYIATQEVPSAMEDLKKRTGLAPIECNIKNLKATWGICSSNKKISINQNLMAYSRHAIEYVCLHEICHLKYMNHSKEFWNMIEYYMPDYKLAKKELKG